MRPAGWTEADGDGNEQAGRPMGVRPAYSLGGDEGARTLDPRLAKPMLSQLSYVPVAPAYSSIGPEPPPRLIVREDAVLLRGADDTVSSLAFHPVESRIRRPNHGFESAAVHRVLGDAERSGVNAGRQ
jgi:hypothetical protein